MEVTTDAPGDMGAQRGWPTLTNLAKSDLAGLHYPSDVEAGRISGSVINNVLLHDAAFMADFARAKAEFPRCRRSIA